MTRPLDRTLSLKDLVFIVIGTVIGSGIFLVPGAVLTQSGGSVGLALLVWLIAGILSLLGAFTYGEMGAMRPDAGGLYVYIRDAFGPMLAFLYGWMVFVVAGSGAVATLAVAFTSYAREFVPLSPVAAKVVAVAMIAVVMLINVRGTRQGATVQNLATMLKAGAILVMSVLLLVAGNGFASAETRWWPEVVDGGALAGGVGLALVAVLWAYEGWHYVTFSAGEAMDPQRTFPRAIVAGTALVIGLYLLANVGYIAALNAGGVMRSDRVAAEAVSMHFGNAAGKAIAAVILVSIFSAANGLTLTAPRLYYAMARDGVFFAKLAEVSPRFRTPALAIIVSSVWAMILAATGTFQQLLTYVIFTTWIFFALAGMAIFYYRRNEPNTPRPFRTPGYPVTPALFILAAVAIVLNTLVTQPMRGIVGLAGVALGVPVYFYWRTRRGPPPTEGSVRGTTSRVAGSVE
ncbi:MAG TPA: amino acid permease [Frankiaceae bacterium]|nr:amino acid permease [Frankiaceae bacterium]